MTIPKPWNSSNTAIYQLEYTKDTSSTVLQTFLRPDWQYTLAQTLQYIRWNTPMTLQVPFYIRPVRGLHFFFFFFFKDRMSVTESASTVRESQLQVFFFFRCKVYVCNYKHRFAVKNAFAAKTSRLGIKKKMLQLQLSKCGSDIQRYFSVQGHMAVN